MIIQIEGRRLAWVGYNHQQKALGGCPLSHPVYRLRSPGDGPEAKPLEDTIKNGGSYA